MDVYRCIHLEIPSATSRLARLLSVRGFTQGEWGSWAPFRRSMRLKMKDGDDRLACGRGQKTEQMLTHGKSLNKTVMEVSH